jgi:hypothetical protein
VKKYVLISLILFAPIYLVAQTATFDIFSYQSPEYFTKTALSSKMLFTMTNKDGSFCTITLCKSHPAKKDAMKDISSQWTEQVVKRLPKVRKKPTRIVTGQLWDGWESSLAIGNFFENKKKCVVMLYSFRKNHTSACAVYTISDKLFKGPVQDFSKTLHLIDQP